MLTRTDWATLKGIKTLYGIPMYYIQDGTTYTVVEGSLYHQYWTVLKESSDITDFVNNYKSAATSVLSEDDAISKILYGTSTPNDIVLTLNAILSQLGGTSGTVTTVIKDSEFTVTTRSEVDVTNTSYTVPTNKVFRVTQFGASSDNPSGAVFRLKVYNGSTLVRTIKLILGSSGSNSFTWPNGIQIATAGQVVKITHEAQAAKGTGWCGFAGFEQ